MSQLRIIFSNLEAAEAGSYRIENQIPAGKLASLQALRGIAAFLVLLFHIDAIQREIYVNIHNSSLQAVSGFWDRGFAGVDMFFVISGFIMVYISRGIAGTPAGIFQFLYKRATRIYPLWWAYCAIWMLYFWLAYSLPGAPERIMASGGSFPYVLKSVLLLPQAAPPILGLGWTLIHEVYFYLVFALLLLLPARLLGWSLLAWAGAVIMAALMGYSQTETTGFFSLTTSLLTLEFIAGAMAALLVAHIKIRFAKWLAAFGAVAFTASLLWYQPDSNDAIAWQRILLFGLPCAVLIAGLARTDKDQKTSVPNWLIALGNCSFSLYLSHYLVLSAVKRVYVKLEQTQTALWPQVLHVGSNGLVDDMVFIALCISLSLAVAWVSYIALEKPMLRLSRRLNPVKT